MAKRISSTSNKGEKFVHSLNKTSYKLKFEIFFMKPKSNVHVRKNYRRSAEEWTRAKLVAGCGKTQ